MSRHSQQPDGLAHGDFTTTTVGPLHAPGASGTTRDPTLIIVLGWMNAKRQHLLKYTEAYQGFYPQSPRVLITADSWWYWRTQKAREHRMLPIIEQLNQTGVLQESGTLGQQPRVLIHVLSNGGACSLFDLANALSDNAHAIRDATSAIVFDSAPGGGTLLSANRSFTAGLRNPIMKCLAMAIVSTVYFLMLGLRVVTRQPHPFKDMLAALNSPTFLPWTSKKTPRLYIYSSGDKIVEDYIVEEHAASAKALGLDVRLEHFGKSGHVGHLREDPDRYWASVRALWADAVREV